jgi:2-beta-glucuronyltransferase
MSENFLVLSGHDYRTPRRASMHFIADELARRGTVRFFSLGFSSLSRLTNDLRMSVANRANREETFNGVECYLWKTPLHPFNSGTRILRPIEYLLFWLYKNTPSPVMLEWIREADVVLLESGIAPIFCEHVFKLNPRARIIYRASDDLAAIGVSPFVKQVFRRVARRMDAVNLTSRRFVSSIPPASRVFYVPHGLDPRIADHADPSPYASGTHAVSVGSMLFDARFFVLAASQFPAVTFHVIGSGRPRLVDYPANVLVYDHMQYTDTLRYIKHATFGVAPYVAETIPEYLADTSMKLMQYEFFGLPAVCPHPVVGGHRSRLGYTPGDKASIAEAIRRALGAERVTSKTWLSWSEVVDRLLQPEHFADTRMTSTSSPG